MKKHKYFNRKLKTKLSKWARKRIKQPILIQGIRRVGKTSFIKNFAESKYEKIGYFNFKENPELRDMFKLNRDPDEMIERLSYHVDEHMYPDQYLIFFDDIDYCIDAINYLPRFNELIAQFSIVAAGSYFQKFDKQKKPGYDEEVKRMTLHPVDFKEWLDASSQMCAASYTHFYKYGRLKTIRPRFNKMVVERFNDFLRVGGMPEALSTYYKTKSIEEASKIQQRINTTIQADFLKFNRSSKAKKILDVWESLPGQLNNSNMKFMYSRVNRYGKGRSYTDAINWLVDARLVSKTNSCDIKGTDLKIGKSRFVLVPALFVYPIINSTIKTKELKLLYLLEQLNNSSLYTPLLKKTRLLALIPKNKSLPMNCSNNTENPASNCQISTSKETSINTYPSISTHQNQAPEEVIHSQPENLEKYKFIKLKLNNDRTMLSIDSTDKSMKLPTFLGAKLDQLINEYILEESSIVNIKNAKVA